MGRRARLRSAAAAGAPSPTACGCATGFISRCSGTRTPIRFSSATRSARPRRRKCSTAARSITPSPATARAMPASTTPSCIAKRSCPRSVQRCNAFCRAAKTQVFNGSQIDYAVASNGARYAGLDNAFVYRQKIVPGCTCNGRDAFGLAKIDVAHDPTLRPGDIVASGDNQKAALLAAANKQARSTVTEKPAALRTKAKPADPEAEEKQIGRAHV